MTLPLRRRDGTIRAYALVSADDYSKAAQYRWCARPSGDDLRPIRRASRKDGHRTIYLYRWLLGLRADDGREVDHRNGEPLDCRRLNLRVVTHAQNAQNRRGAPRHSRTQVRGITWDKRDRRWRAQATVDGRHYNLGYFTRSIDAEQAAVAFRRERMSHSEMDVTA